MRGVITILLLVACGGGQLADTTTIAPTTAATTISTTTSPTTMASTTSPSFDDQSGYGASDTTAVATSTTSTTSTLAPTTTEVATTLAPTTVTATTLAAGTTVTVGLENFAIIPSRVTIRVGDSIHWVVNSGGHTTTSGSGSPDGLWDVAVGADGFTRLFDQPGTYNYFCRFHPGDMKGTIVVEP